MHVMDSLGAQVAVEVPGFGLVVAAVVPANRRADEEQVVWISCRNPVASLLQDEEQVVWISCRNDIAFKHCRLTGVNALFEQIEQVCGKVLSAAAH